MRPYEFERRMMIMFGLVSATLLTALVMLLN
jgi:hypothetical protein